MHKNVRGVEMEAGANAEAEATRRDRMTVLAYMLFNFDSFGICEFREV